MSYKYCVQYNDQAMGIYTDYFLGHACRRLMANSVNFSSQDEIGMAMLRSFVCQSKKYT